MTTTTPKFRVTKKLVRKLQEAIAPGLCMGMGDPIPGKMCVEAAVCYAMGLPHSDEPTCVDLVLRSFKIALNDATWSSNLARAKGMERLAIAQLGSMGKFDGKYFAEKMAMYSVNVLLPRVFNEVAKLEQSAVHKEKLLAVIPDCKKAKNLTAANAAASTATAAATAANAAASTAAAAATAATAAASTAAYAAYAAYAAAASTAAAATSVRAAAATRDKHLIDMANYATELCIEMDTPGSRFLYMVEDAA